LKESENLHHLASKKDISRNVILKNRTNVLYWGKLNMTRAARRV